MVQDDFDNSDFETIVQNAVIYGTGVLVMDFKNGDLLTRVVPIEEYTELGEQLKWIQQNTKANDDS
jgi:hypothetical protein